LFGAGSRFPKGRRLPRSGSNLLRQELMGRRQAAEKRLQLGIATGWLDGAEVGTPVAASFEPGRVLRSDQRHLPSWAAAALQLGQSRFAADRRFGSQAGTAGDEIGPTVCERKL